MKCSIPEISWHNREPVLSLDFQPINTTNNDFYRLATAGSDNLVLIWKLTILKDGQVDVKVLSELTRHQRSVNVVKWSPSGEFLASGDDDANIILWQLRTDNIPSLDDRENEFEEKWNAFKVLRGHKEDVYDLCWSPKSDKLLSGSVDNSAILWDVIKGKNEHIIKDHKGFIQGVAWDPKNDFLATLCSDRVCRVFERNGRRVRARIGRGRLPVDESSEFFDKDVKYFHDDTFKTYFRRLNFSPDGSLLLVPSGAVETDEKKNALFGTFGFTLDSLNNPACVLPSGKQCSIAVKCCPVLFNLRENGPKPLVDLPYRMVIAVATDSDVILYDTQQLSPCVHLQNIHYTRLTDLSWSVDGLLLAASSTDGFITLITFDEGELGTVYIKDESDVEDSILNISGCEVLQEEEKVLEDTEKNTEKLKKPSFLQQWTKQASKRKPEEMSDDPEVKKAKIEANIEETTEKLPIEMNIKNSEVEEIKAEVTKKRITPILISKDVKDKATHQLTTQDKSLCKPVEITENRPKKRVQLIKIGEVDHDKKNKSKQMQKLENCAETQPETSKAESTVIDITQNDNKPFKVIEEGSESAHNVNLLKLNEESMLAPTTPKNKTATESSTDTLSTPTSTTKKTPKQKPLQTEKSVSEKTSSTKKKKPVPPSNTLFNYMKPIPKTPSSESKIEVKADCKKTLLKPLKLFGRDMHDDKESPIKVANAIVTKDSSVLPQLEETATDLPDDFVLRVDDDVIVVDDDTNECVEKENGDDKSPEVKTGLESVAKDLQDEVSLKTKRRIPLITLSSPKNKKKPKAE